VANAARIGKMRNGYRALVRVSQGSTVQDLQEKNVYEKIILQWILKKYDLGCLKVAEVRRELY
jgi:hypothetical protein